MEFEAHRPIYLQIVDYLGNRILAGDLEPGERAPSARDLASILAVTPNTVARACALLQEQGVLANRRGVGQFVTETAAKQIRAMRKQEFIETTLPDLFKTMQQVDFSLEDLRQHYKAFLQRPDEPD